MTTPTTGLGSLAVDVAERLSASGVMSTVRLAPDLTVELIVQLDPMTGQVAAIVVDDWGRAYIHQEGQDARAIDGPVLGGDLCVEHGVCASLWTWTWVLTHRGLQW